MLSCHNIPIFMKYSTLSGNLAFFLHHCPISFHVCPFLYLLMPHDISPLCSFMHYKMPFYEMSSLPRKLALFILKCACLFHFSGLFYLLMPEDHFLVLFFTSHAFFHEILCPNSNMCPFSNVSVHSTSV